MLKAVILIGGPQKGEEPGELGEEVGLEWSVGWGQREAGS